MIAARRLICATIVVVLVACSEIGPEPSTGPSVIVPPDFRSALAAQRLHTPKLLDIPGVVGTAVTGLADGHPGVLLLVERSGIPGLPQSLDGVPVTVQVTGRIMAFSDPTQRQRPAPLGFSVGHPAITAGTIGARVRDAQGRVYILSNNHVLANSNGATIGDPEYQPGPYDGGTSADSIATLTDFETINFAGGDNTIDAAIALSGVNVLDNSVPSDDGYGMPNSKIYGDTNNDGIFDNRDALLGLNVQKYGRTTHLTHGQITGINATVAVCYAASGLTCTKIARYVDQLIISPGTFSGGGDSGSLIVTDDANLNPVALLFAGSPSVTIANRIDLVLNRFGVTIDGSSPPPPGPLTDLAITTVNAPSPVVLGTTVAVTVTVKNFGNQDVSSFDVTLQDTTAHVTVGTQTIAGLVAGAGTTLTFNWSPAANGDHILLARHSLHDDRPGNDQRDVTVSVIPPVTDVAVSAINPSGSLIQGHVVSVGVIVANVGNQPVGSSFDVTLRDSTDGVTLGTQTVSGLAVGGNATLTFTWDLTSASLGGHTLIATHTLTDDNAANNRRSLVVTVSPKPTDLAVTSITAPARVNQGDTAHVLVTIKNVGEVDVGAGFAVVLTDGWGGPTLGTQTVGGLVVGAATTVDIPWNTAGAAVAGHTLFATQQLADNNSANNTMAVGITVNPPLTTDVAVTAVNAPARVSQASTAAVDVTVQNVGGKSVVSSFTIVLTDSTSGVTIGSQTIAGLAVGASATRSFTWNTTGAALGNHTLVATQTLTDDNAANNQGSVTVTVGAPSTDVAVTAVSAPAAVTKGSTAAIGVTVQNVGGQDVSATFNVVLTDATDGVTIGTQAVIGLAMGASAIRSFSWSTSSATLGTHTLVATQSLADDNASNNQRSTTVSVASSPADLALTGITAPSQVTVGDTVAVVATVQNVGGQDVTTNFDVVLTDGTAGNSVIGTQTISGLAAGATAATTFQWNTAGVAVSGHTLIATQELADNNASNNSMAVGISVNPPSVHVGNLDASADTTGSVWSATVVITAHDGGHRLLNGVTVHGLWNGAGSDITCVTGLGGATTGTCSVVLDSIPITGRFASFGVSGMTLAGYAYKPSANHDPDGDSNGYSILVSRF
jgi:hypothetical protein